MLLAGWREGSVEREREGKVRQGVLKEEDVIEKPTAALLKKRNAKKKENSASKSNILRDRRKTKRIGK